eukprot:g41134.t1
MTCSRDSRVSGLVLLWLVQVGSPVASEQLEGAAQQAPWLMGNVEQFGIRDGTEATISSMRLEDQTKVFRKLVENVCWELKVMTVVSIVPEQKNGKPQMLQKLMHSAAFLIS